MKFVLNLTQHPATIEQSDAGVVDLAESDMRELQKLLTFNELPSKEEIKERALSIANMAESYGFNNHKVMIGGAPYLMKVLERVLKDYGIRPVYAFSKREVVEKTMPDGSIQKLSVFRHNGFVEA